MSAAASHAPTSDESRIRARIDDWAAALRAKDVERLMAHYTPDTVKADLAPPLWNTGAATVRRNYERWFPTWSGPLGFEVHQLDIVAGDAVAFARSLNRLSGTKTDDSRHDIWVRATVCFRKIDGDWKVAHEHVSVPFYMDGSDRAAVDLAP